MSKTMNTPAKIAALPSRAVLRLAGADRFSFLQGLITQDVKIAQEGRPFFTAFLTPQGKYLADFFVVPQGDRLLLDCEAEAATDLLKRLMHFKMRSAMTLDDVRDDYAAYAAWGGALTHSDAYTDPRLAALGQRLILKKEAILETTHDEAAYRTYRIKHGVPEGLHEIEAGHAIVLELNFDRLNAVSWDKGCYMGQELTARTRYRGLIKKRYLPFSYEGVEPLKHLSLQDKGFHVGDVKALAHGYGLGLFNLEKAAPFIRQHQPLIYEGTSFTISLPAFLDNSVLTAAAP